MAWTPIKRLLNQAVGQRDEAPARPSNLAWPPERPRMPDFASRAPDPVLDPMTEFEPPRREQAPPQPPKPFAAFDAIGQRSETLRVRISQMVERLDDLKSLQDDFGLILEPLSTLADELPQAKIRIAELEVLLAREQDQAGNMRREFADLAGRAATSANELAAFNVEHQRLDAQLRERDTEIEELRLRLRERTIQAENLERQHFAEAEQVRALTGENRSLRAETQSADQARTRAERELTELGERLSLAEQDARRLQLLAEEQAVKLAEAEARVGELSQQVEALRQRNRDLDAHVAAETAARERGEAQFETELAASRAERANLTMKLDASLGRAGTLEQLLAQARNQLREREESGRTAERTLKETAIEKTTLERRLEGLQAELHRQTDRLSEIQRARAEGDARADMLAKALAAKEAALEQAQIRSTALADRIEQVGRRHEAEKAELQAATKRLVEELQAERSERALAQGALDIARETRASLQKQHEALKRAVRNLHDIDPATLTGAAGREARPERAEPSNVRPFPPPDRESADARSADQD